MALVAQDTHTHRLRLKKMFEDHFDEIGNLG